MTQAPLEIGYFSDILCVWAYVGQIRLDKLREHFGERVRVVDRFINVYGDVTRRIQEHCGDAQEPNVAYGEKMQRIAKRFEHTRMHNDCFTKVIPLSSNQAHLVLGGIRALVNAGELNDSDGIVCRLARRMRVRSSKKPWTLVDSRFSLASSKRNRLPVMR